MTNKIILTDCDGVLCDWEHTFYDWMASKGYTQVVKGVYEMEIAFGISKPECKKLIREFNESAWMGFLPALRDARSGVAKLVEAGYQFICITSLSLDDKARMLRVSNLKNLFGKNVFLDVVCLDTGADKDEALAPYEGTGMYWLEDKAENAECGQKLGLKSILIEHNHNSDYVNDDIVRVANWAEIVDVIVND
jgi:FMN phosphatase YigB (HAD superfamily)